MTEPSHWTASAAFLLFLAVTSCAGPTGHGAGHSHHGPVHVGAIDAETLLRDHPAFQASHQQFQPTQEQLAIAEKLPEDLQIEVHFGTWCHDSKRELGRFIKLMQSRRVPLRVSYLALNTDKRDTTGRAAELGIRYTPTFVVFRNGREIGRIVERPRVDLMSDIRAMLGPAADR